MCALEILIVIKDPAYDKVQVYNSLEGSLPFQTLEKMLQDGRPSGSRALKITKITDEDYASLKNDRDQDSDNDIVDDTSPLVKVEQNILEHPVTATVEMDDAAVGQVIKQPKTTNKRARKGLNKRVRCTTQQLPISTKVTP